MERKQFCPLNLARLGNDDASTLFQLTIDVANPHSALIGEMAGVALQHLITGASPFIDQNNRLRQSPLSVPINKARLLNNDLVSEIKRTVVYEKKSRNEERKTAAQEVDFFFKPYWDLSKCALGTHIKDVNELVGKYEADATILAKCKLLGVDVPMLELKTNNTHLTSMYLTRNMEVGGRASSGTDLRPAAMEAYNLFCNVVEQSVNLLPNDNLLELFIAMDELRAKAKALIAKPKEKTVENEVNA